MAYDDGYSGGYSGGGGLVATNPLARAEMLLRASKYSGSGNWLDETVNGHDAKFPGGTNDPLVHTYNGEQYAYFYAVVGDGCSIPIAGTSDPLNITGDVDCRFRVSIDDVTAPGPNYVFISQTNLPYGLYILNPNGRITTWFGLAAGGQVTVSCSVAPSWSAGQVTWIRVTRDATSGDINFYESFDDTNDDTAVTWTKLGITIGGTAGALVDAGSTFYIARWSGGTSPWGGRMYRTVVYDGIDGTKVLDVDFTDQLRLKEPYATFEEKANDKTVTFLRAATGHVPVVVNEAQFSFATDDYMYVTDDDGLDFDSGEDFTVMVVARRYVASPAANPRLVSKYATGGVPGGVGYTLYVAHSSEQVQLFLDDGTFSVTEAKVSPTTVAGERYIAAAVRDAGTDLLAFIDGAPGVSPATDTTGDLTHTGNLLIGGQTSSFSSTEIMAVVLWREALSDADVLQAGIDLTTPGFEPFPTDYEYVAVPWNQNILELQELTPGKQYAISVAAFDFADRTSGYAFDTYVTAAQDQIPPSRPAAPTVAGSPLQIQVSHTLGKNSGGTFNLEPDLDHLNVYVGSTPGFTADSSSKIGAMPVTAGHLLLGITAIGNFPVTDAATRYVKVGAVDYSGNESVISPEASVTADLIDTAQIADLAVTNAKINDLSAGKITAGTITSHEIIIAGGTGGVLRSDNYVDGVSGWYIDGAGTLKAYSAELVGAVTASSGDLGDLTISGTLTMTSGRIATDVSPNHRVELGNGPYVTLYTSSLSEALPGQISAEVFGGGVHMSINAPTVTGDSGANTIDFYSPQGFFPANYGIILTSPEQAIRFDAYNGVETWTRGNKRTVVDSNIPFRIYAGAGTGVERFTFTGFGELGINDSSPNAMIDIGTTSSSVSDLLFQGRSAATSAGQWIFDIRSDEFAVNTSKFIIQADGQIRTPRRPTVTATADIQISSSGDIGEAVSLRAHKQNISDWSDPSVALSLRPVSYEWNKEKAPDAPDGFEVGLVAEEVESVDPMFATYRDGDLTGVFYSRLTVPLIAVAQDHEKRLRRLEKKEMP